MPQINRIRIVNVPFNGYRSHFQDLRLSFFGKSGTYDLYNGGGKSVLLLLLLQTVLPGSTLDKEQPLKNIFINTAPNHTAHALIEWILDEGSGFNYLLTGFCMRAKKEAAQEVSEADEDMMDVYGIEYFNYYHLYNQPNEFDIDHIELVTKDQERISFLGFESLKTLLEQKQRTTGIDVFPSKRLKDYRRFLRHYGIIDAEWKMIKDLNQDENYITRYFRTNDTSRKLIENLLLELIENVERSTSRNVRESLTSSMMLAKGLLEIRENLNQLYKDKEQREDYHRVQGYYDQLKRWTEILLGDYLHYDEVCKQFVRVARKLEKITEEMALEVEIIDLDIAKLEDQMQKLRYAQACLKVQVQEFVRAQKDEEIASLELLLKNLQVKSLEAEQKLNEAMAQNSYCDYKEVVEEITAAETELENLNKSADEIDCEWLEAGYNYRIETEKLLAPYGQKVADAEKMVLGLQTVEEDLQLEKNVISTQKGEMNGLILAQEKQLKKEDQEIRQHKNILEQNGYTVWLLQPSEGLHELTGQITQHQEHLTVTEEKILLLEEQMRFAQEQKIAFESQLKVLDAEMAPLKNRLKDYQQAKSSFQGIAFTYRFKGNAPDLYKKIEQEKSALESKSYQLKADKEIKAQKEHLLLELGYYIPNQEVLRLHQYLEDCLGNTFLGAEWLNDAENMEELLVQNPLLPYSVIVTGKNFEKLKANTGLLKDKFSDYAIPIQSLDLVRSGVAPAENILFSGGNQGLYTNKEQFISYINDLADEQTKLEYELSRISNDIVTRKESIRVLENYIELEREIPDIESALSEKYRCNTVLQEQTRQLTEQVTESLQELELREALSKELNQKLDKLIEMKQSLQSYIEKSAQLREIELGIQQLRQERQSINDRLERKDYEIQTAKEQLKSSIQILNDLKTRQKEIETEAESLTQFNKGVYIEAGYETAKNKYLSLKSQRSGVSHDREVIAARLERCIKRRTNAIDALKNYGLDIDYFSRQEKLTLPLARIGPEMIAILQGQKHRLTDEYKKRDKACNDLAQESKKLEGSIGTETDRIWADYRQAYTPSESVHTREEADALSKELQKDLAGHDHRCKNFRQKRDNVLGEKRYYDNEYFKFTGQLTEYGHLTDEIAEEIEEFTAINERFKKIKESIQKNKDNLSEKIKQSMDEARELSVYNYAKPIEKFTLPQNFSAAQSLLAAISECLSLLSSKIREIDEEIQTLEGYREDHVNLCLQRAEEIMLELKKMNTLPAIMINGKLENMVKIEFKDFSDEDKRGRMGEYIISLAQGEANVKTLSKKLSAKYLLDRITDMDKAKVKLFKVEADYEESRYLDWKHAVGSTGQKSALYINFLITLISFIRLIGNHADFGKSSKVLILDNPYATFSSPYLWEPIFKILQENNVQLIAPGYQINARIVSKFDVNYILDEDVSTNRKKVVLKDVRTEVDMNQMAFSKLEFTQDTLY